MDNYGTPSIIVHLLLKPLKGETPSKVRDRQSPNFVQRERIWNSPSHRKYQRRILPFVLITETERQRLWRACGIILAKVWLVEAFEQIDWSGVGTKEP